MHLRSFPVCLLPFVAGEGGIVEADHKVEVRSLLLDCTATGPCSVQSCQAGLVVGPVAFVVHEL